MEKITKMVVKAREYAKGQTMAEYADPGSSRGRGVRRLPDDGHDHHHVAGER